MLHVKQFKIDQITPYEKNGKTHTEEQVKKIANSIREFGFQQPIVVDKENVIIVGHGRFEAAKSLELEAVPVVVADHLTPAQVKAYRLADNKLNESFWNSEIILEELEDLQLQDYDINLTGFDESYLNKDMDEPEPEDNRTKAGKLVECPECGHEFKP